MDFHEATFKDVDVHIGGHKFIATSFVNCRLIYDGSPVYMSNCVYESCSWDMQDSASNTVALLRALSLEPDYRSMIQAMLFSESD